MITLIEPHYTSVEKRPEHGGREVIGPIAARRTTYKKLDKRNALCKSKSKIEKANAQVCAKVEHPFWTIKRQFSYVKTHFRSLADQEHGATRDTVALSNL